jgi:signal peptidase
MRVEMDRTPRRPLLARLLDLVLGGFILSVVVTAMVDTILPLTGHPVVVITGASMEPSIAIGSIVIEDRPTTAPLAPGDVGSFRLESGATVTHRVMRAVERSDGTWYEVKGDANAAPDPVLVPPSSVMGRVLASIPMLGYLTWLLHLPSGILAVVTATLALYIAGLLADPTRRKPAGTPEQVPDLDVAEGPVRLPA